MGFRSRFRRIFGGGGREDQPQGQSTPPGQDRAPEQQQSRRDQHPRQEQPPGQQLPPINLLPDAENPWGVPAIDVSPVTTMMVSGTGNEQAALNARSYGGEDGSSFEDEAPPSDLETAVNLEYRCASPLLNGMLFTPARMEDKWAIYLRSNRIIFVRSWMRQVLAVAELEASGDRMTVTRIRGDFGQANSSDAGHSHAMHQIPLLIGQSQESPPQSGADTAPQADQKEDAERPLA